MRNLLPGLVVATLAGSCISSTVCCDRGDGPGRVAYGACKAGQRVSEASCPDLAAFDPDADGDLSLAACRSFCEAILEACPETDDCFDACLESETVPEVRAIDCARDAADCAGAGVCWAWVTGTPP